MELKTRKIIAFMIIMIIIFPFSSLGCQKFNTDKTDYGVFIGMSTEATDIEGWSTVVIYLSPL